MNMKWHKSLLAISLISLSMTCYAYDKLARVTLKPLETKAFQRPHIDNINLDGNAQFVLQNGAPTLKITNYGNTKNVVQVRYNNHELKITAPDAANNLQITITSPHLVNLTVKGRASVDAERLSLMNLYILADKHDINLDGQFFAEKTIIDQSGYGRTKIEWLASNKVIVKGQKGVVWLAGRTDNLIADLSSNSYLNSKYLRADNIYIKAKRSARADISPLEQLVAVTKDHSNVYYYTKPKNAFISSVDSSNVLLLN
jgi:hypothetical protein